MEELCVTVVGQDLFKIVREKIESARVNNIKEVNRGMLGNLKTLTYSGEVDEVNVIFTRKTLMEKLAQDEMRLMPMYPYGNWMRIIVTKPF